MAPDRGRRIGRNDSIGIPVRTDSALELDCCTTLPQREIPLTEGA